jgi:hypothetical protein
MQLRLHIINLVSGARVRSDVFYRFIWSCRRAAMDAHVMSGLRRFRT